MRGQDRIKPGVSSVVQPNLGIFCDRDAMATSRFNITSDPIQSMLRIRMTGVWTRGDVLDFVVEEELAAARLPCQPGEHLVLADLSDFNLQTPPVVGLFQEFIRNPALRSKRLALVGGAGMAWIQIQKMMVRDGIAAFDRVETAERWLISGDDDLGCGLDETQLRRNAIASQDNRHVLFDRPILPA